MGLLTKGDEGRQERDANPTRRFEYLARNLDKIPGMALENEANKEGERGWEAVCEAKGYLIFKREIT